MKLFSQDLITGLSNEEIVKMEIEAKWNVKLTHRSKYNPFDFDGENLLIEVKSRQIAHNQYDTCLIGLNKITLGLKLEKENPDLQVFFFWKYTDGIFYAKLGDFEYKINDNYSRGERADRVGKDINKQTAFIHYKYLTEFSK
jgi:hypothetical protein